MAKRQRLAPARNLPVTENGSERLPASDVFADFPAAADGPARRAPIADVAGDAAERAALAELAETLRSARTEGRMIQRLPLEAVDEGYLVRDRMAADEEEMKALCDSLRARGQQMAIEVADLGDGRWGLISGWRRLSALRRLNAAGEGPDSVLALARAPQEAADAYLAMVEENEIRVGLSYYERARIVARAVDKGVFRTDRAALAALFQAASRPKRSKIGSFVRIVRALDPVLRFPTSLTERSGLALAAALETDAELAARLSAALDESAPATVEDETAIIAAAVAESAGGPVRAQHVPMEQMALPSAAAFDADMTTPEAVLPTATSATPEADPEPHASLVRVRQGEGEKTQKSGKRQVLLDAEDTDLDTSRALRPGLEVTTHADGSLTVAGEAVRDPAFRARLFAWLKDE